MSYLIDDMEKWAEDRDAKADLRYLDQLYEETQAAQRKYNQGLKRSKRMGNTGLATGLGGIGLTLASIQGKPSKLKAKGTMAGAGLIMGSLIPLVGSEVVKYKAIRGAQNHIDSLRNNKELQAIEREYQRAQAEQEKTAAPMFGKGRYIPRNEVDDRHRAYDRLVEHERKKDNHDPSYNRKSHREDEEAYDKANQAYDDMVERNKQTTAFRRKHITLPTVVSAMIASDALKEKALGDRSDAKAFGLAAGLVGAYPAFQGARIGIKELKNRYHWSKQENIDKDRAEREKDQDVYDRAYKPWFAPRGNERLGK